MKRLITPEQAQAYIRQAVRSYKADKDADRIESGFSSWCKDTLMPDVVNRHLKEIGDDVLQ